MDSVRDGQFTLANTNKMLRQYKGLTGLKTGFIRKAGFCISATAMRDGMELIAVVMAAETKEDRMADATTLLNYGFANFTQITPEYNSADNQVPVLLGKEAFVTGSIDKIQPVVVSKEDASKITYEAVMQEDVKAPVYQGQTIGSFIVKSEGQELMNIPIKADKDVDALGYFDVFMQMLSVILMK